MKFSVSMYSYMQKIRSGEATLFELIAKTAELGFDAIEFVDFTDFGTGASRKSASPTPKSSARNASASALRFSALVMSCDFITGSDGDLDKEIARVKDYVDIAHVLGVTRMRHDAAIGYARNSGDFARLIRSRASQRPARKSLSTLHSSASAPWSKTTASMCRIPSVSRSFTRRQQKLRSPHRYGQLPLRR